jgi:hypothetical protein
MTPLVATEMVRIMIDYHITSFVKCSHGLTF